MKVTRNAGMLVLGIWLILTGILPFLRIAFSPMSLILAALALIAGILILIGR